MNYFTDVTYTYDIILEKAIKDVLHEVKTLRIKAFFKEADKLEAALLTFI